MKVERTSIDGMPAFLVESPGAPEAGVMFSVGLADVIHRCLSERPADRYPDAAGLAADLRRHLTDQPLVGVRNRSVLERYRKWRRRQPQKLRLAIMAAAVLIAVGAGVAASVAYLRDQAGQAMCLVLGLTHRLAAVFRRHVGLPLKEFKITLYGRERCAQFV